MKLRSPAGLAAGIVLMLAAPAWAGPAVTVRVEGAGGTLLERTRVTLPDAAAPPCGAPHTAAAAIEAATGGNWDRQAFTQTIMGETHRFDDADYWAEWVDRGAGPKRGAGVCNDVLAEGDEVVMLADRSPAPSFAPTVFPLDVEGMPAQVRRGEPVTVTVAEYRSATGAEGEGDRTLVAGATVAGGGAVATTGGDGRATLVFGSSGIFAVKATRPGNAASGAEVVTVADAAVAPAPGAVVVPDRVGPVARIAGIREQQRFRRGRAPRVLRGSVAPDPSGLRAVKLRLTRQVGRRCWYFSGSRERFLRRRCGTRHAFRIGDDERWSYLLPQRLGRGRYVLDVLTLDGARNRDRLERGRSRVVFHVGAMPRARRAAAPTVRRAGAAGRVEVMVVGRERVLRASRQVRLKVRSVRVGRRRCRVGAATPLSVLAATRLRLRIEDFARCGRRPRDAGGLYVQAIGRERERGDGGWVYKVGRRVGTAGAADPSGSFGSGRRLRAGQRVLWFWCVRAGRCQRTLEVRPERSAVAPGEPLRVTVRGYDDQGAGVPVAGATVRLGSATALTGADGSAVVTAPATAGTRDLEAERDGMVPAFPREVRVG